MHGASTITAVYRLVNSWIENKEDACCFAVILNLVSCN